MKNSIKKLMVMAAIGMSFVAVQSASAGEITGTIDEISTNPNVVVVDGMEIYGVKINALCNQDSICLEEGNTVTIEYYEQYCADLDEYIYKASSVTVAVPVED
ncbi:MAG: hypothetical protein AB1461_04240 [Thermodesulfobacteriota bacterium]